MDIDYLTRFELKEMLQHPDLEDEEGMLLVSAKLRELPHDNRARFYFERYCDVFEQGYENGLSSSEILDENLSIAYEHPLLPDELRTIIAAAGWFKYFQHEKEEKKG